MPRFRPRGMLAKSAVEDLDRHTLSRIHSVYGKLAYLASLKDPATDIYRHHGLSAAFGREEAQNALRESHQSVFAEWLNTNLSDKYEDLTTYLISLEAPVPETIKLWLEHRNYKSSIPASASEAEKALFVSDQDALLMALKFEVDAGKWGRATSPPG